MPENLRKKLRSYLKDSVKPENPCDFCDEIVGLLNSSTLGKSEKREILIQENVVCPTVECAMANKCPN